MRRMVSNDDMWSRIEHHLPGKSSDRGRTGANNRLILEAVLWVLRARAPWRELPEEFGPWNSVYIRYSRWSHKGHWRAIFQALSAYDGDFECVMVDGSIVRIHQDGAPKKTERAIEAVGRSRGGQSTKIHATCDALGNPVRFILMPGSRATILNSVKQKLCNKG